VKEDIHNFLQGTAFALGSTSTSSNFVGPKEWNQERKEKKEKEGKRKRKKKKRFTVKHWSWFFSFFFKKNFIVMNLLGLFDKKEQDSKE